MPAASCPPQPDSGLVSERDVRFRLRPGALWSPRCSTSTRRTATRVCYPITNTALNDFNFASPSRRNAFTARQDFDNNLLTLGPDHALFWMPRRRSDRTPLVWPSAQVLRDQRVTLDASSQPAQQGFSDIMLGASLNLDERWMPDSTLQYKRQDRPV